MNSERFDRSVLKRNCARSQNVLCVCLMFEMITLEGITEYI